MRFEYRRSEDARHNLGVGNFNLMERAFERSSNEHQVRTSLQSVMGRSALNEFRVAVELRRDGVGFDVERTGGDRDRRVQQRRCRRVERGIDADARSGRQLRLQRRKARDAGRHAVRGGRVSQSRCAQCAGTFTFSSLEAFLAGAPNTFTQRLGQLQTAFSQYQLGVYWQDDFRLNRSLSLSVGVREELQTHVGDAMNLMPRVGFTFTPPRSRTTIRGGYGIFHDWYEADLHDQTLRVTGEAGCTARSAWCSTPGYPDPTGGVAATVLGSGRVQADPDLEMPYVHQASIGLERAVTQSAHAAGVVHADARLQPAALAQRERAGRVRRSS